MCETLLLSYHWTLFITLLLPCSFVFQKAGGSGAPVRVFLLAFLCVNLTNAFHHHLLCLSFCVRGAKWSCLEPCLSSQQVTSSLGSCGVVPAHRHCSPLVALKGAEGVWKRMEWTSVNNFYKSSVLRSYDHKWLNGKLLKIVLLLREKQF